MLNPINHNTSQPSPQIILLEDIGVSLRKFSIKGLSERIRKSDSVLNSWTKLNSQVKYSDFVNDMFILYFTALLESLQSFDARVFLSIETQQNFLRSINQAITYFERIRRDKNSNSQVEYPYHYDEFGDIENIVKTLPGKKDFSLKYLPDGLKIKFSFTQQNIESEKKDTGGKVISLIQPSFEEREFLDLPISTREILSSYVALNAQISIDSNQSHTSRLGYKRLLERDWGKLQEYSEDIIIDKNDSINLVVLSIINNLLQYFDTTLPQLKDDAEKYTFFIEALTTMNSMFISKITSTNRYDGLSDNEVKSILTQGLDTKFRELFPEYADNRLSNQGNIITFKK